VLLVWFIVLMPVLFMWLGFSDLRQAFQRRNSAPAKAKLVGQCLIGGALLAIAVAYWKDQWDRKQVFMEECKAEYASYYFRLYPGDTSGLHDYCEKKFGE
jgi:hypothetical protein